MTVDPRSRAVTFDLWHTLVYLEPRAEECYDQRQAELAVRVLERSPPVPGRRRGNASESPRAAFERERDRAVRAADSGRTISLDRQLTRIARALGRVPRPDAYRTAIRRELERTRFHVTPGALSALRTLRERGWRIAVISNTVGEPGALLRPLLTRMGFDRWVEEYVFSDEEPWSKPAAAIFRAALRRIGTAPARAIHVGDGWSDIEGARRAQLRAGIWFTGARNYGPTYRALHATRGAAEIRARYRVRRLGDVPSLVERILPRTGERRARRTVGQVR